MKRTTMRSSKGKKLYAVRVKRPKPGQIKGQFKDIQSFKRAHAADLRHTAKGEKRQRFIDYISAFAVRIDYGCERAEYNRALSALMKQVDRLKIF